jgi:hypothetical protein
MGMLFNTEGTLDILQKLNDYFGSGNIDAHRGEAADFQNWPRAVAAGGTFKIASDKGLVPPPSFGQGCLVLN